MNCRRSSGSNSGGSQSLVNVNSLGNPNNSNSNQTLEPVISNHIIEDYEENEKCGILDRWPYLLPKQLLIERQKSNFATQMSNEQNSHSIIKHMLNNQWILHNKLSQNKNNDISLNNDIDITDFENMDEITLDICDYKPNEIAIELTLMDFYLFQNIKPRELISTAWKKKDKWLRAPHIMRMIGQFNSVSKWVQWTILTGKDIKIRSHYIKQFIDIAICLKELQNFSSLCAVHAGLVCMNISTLKPEWIKVNKNNKMKTKMEEITSIFGWQTPKLKELHANAKGKA